jgi:class 3 adenylate cyclase
MDKKPVERRLAAILAADVVGYSRLMGADEVGTLDALKAHRGELIDPAVALHHGRLVKTTGDGLLLEFASVIDAISCAVAIQRGMLSRNAAVPEDHRIVFRIGINIGDIIIEGGDIFGDGVNVAARLEALCEPGGICISRAANEQVRDKLSLSFADLGEHTVKNIARAVGVFGLAAKDIAALPEVRIAPAELPLGAAKSAPGRRIAVLAAAALAVVAGGGLAWWLAADWLAPPLSLEAQVAAALARGLPTATPKSRADTAKGFVGLGPHRALAIAPKAARSWRTGDWPTPELAEEKVLERCQHQTDEPCALLALGEALAPAGADGRWPIRDMPRVRYAGAFNAERIPGVRARDLRKPEVAGYGAAAAPKAMAFHVNAGLFVATGAASQRAAEEQALRACNGDPARKDIDGPCYLYAAANQVVLPLRQTAAMTPAASTPAVPPSAPTATPSAPAASAATGTLREGLAAILAKVAPEHSAKGSDVQITAYLDGRAHKALVAHPPGNSWRSTGWGSAAVAEERALKACQVRYGSPCVVIAVDEELQPAPAGGVWPQRPTARAAYEGPFDPGRIPGANDSVRQRADVVGYRTQTGAKAAAYHPWGGGRMFIVMAASQNAAETQALAACNADPDRKGDAGPCLLYAVGDQVVLPKRATVPLTP